MNAPVKLDTYMYVPQLGSRLRSPLSGRAWMALGYRRCRRFEKDV
jgi:hypothetical protein